VRLISPTATAQLAEWAAARIIDWDIRSYAPGDLVSATLAFAATNDRAANAAVAQEAGARGILCNVADVPAEGTFHTPATIRHGDVVIAISTLSADPRRAKALRERLEAWLAAQNEDLI
jgi:siroheme synthase-like protein